MKKTTLLALLFGALVLGYLVLSTIRPAAHRVRVCIAFNGAQDCRTASAATEENALRTAIMNACAQLSSGVIQSGQCESTRPVSVDWLK